MKNKKFEDDNDDEDENEDEDDEDEESEESEKELENIIEENPVTNFSSLALEEIIPVLSERGVQTVRQGVRNVQVDENEKEQGGVYEIRTNETNRIRETNERNYKLNDQYSQSGSYDFQQMQKTPDGSPGLMSSRMDNSFTSVMGSQLTPTSQTISQNQNKNISYETNIEKKLREGRKMW